MTYNNVPHPFWLPRFTNAFTYTLDSLFREISSIASTILTSSVVDLLNEEDEFSSTPELESKDNEIVIGNVVINIDVDQNITIVNEVPYYYEIVYTDPETGDEIKGYVYKANVAIEPEEPVGEETECSNIDPQ